MRESGMAVRRATDLDEAIIAYLRRGSSASPRADEAAVLAGDYRDPAGMLIQVRELIEESLGIEVDWNGVTLGEAGRQVAATMRRRHPSLSVEAVDALAWNVTYAFR